MKVIRVHKVSNAEEFISQDHLRLLANCTPSCQFHSMFPIAFKQNENGVLEAVNYIVLMETTEEEMKKLEELKKQDMGEEVIEIGKAIS